MWDTLSTGCRAGGSRLPARATLGQLKSPLIACSRRPRCAMQRNRAGAQSSRNSRGGRSRPVWVEHRGGCAPADDGERRARHPLAGAVAASLHAASARDAARGPCGYRRAAAGLGRVVPSRSSTGRISSATRRAWSTPTLVSTRAHELPFDLQPRRGRARDRLVSTRVASARRPVRTALPRARAARAARRLVGLDECDRALQQRARRGLVVALGRATAGGARWPIPAPRLAVVASVSPSSRLGTTARSGW
jgi:hypothetical protein